MRLLSLGFQQDQLELPDDLQAPDEEPVPVDTLAACLPRALEELSAVDREALTFIGTS